ncbi:hypothetical protein H3S90_02525 [Bartonella sp. W8097]|uniref:hypothetical protein n=1 Tax=Bartonella apihabitans TaxID=2750929 RepID=UPI0018DBB387|nr:hypothetical protein [Bartonella apihabitans]MBI0019960.1 hypothetical protein [Bartonella apihabitans]
MMHALLASPNIITERVNSYSTALPNIYVSNLAIKKAISAMVLIISHGYLMLGNNACKREKRHKEQDFPAKSTDRRTTFRMISMGIIKVSSQTTDLFLINILDASRTISAK